MFRLALGTTTGLGRPRALGKREPTVATLRGLDHHLLAVRRHRVTDMREVRFDLPLRNPEGSRELTGLPRTPPEQCDDLLSECRCPMFHRASSLHAHSCVRSYTISTTYSLVVAHALRAIVLRVWSCVKTREALFQPGVLRYTQRYLAREGLSPSVSLDCVAHHHPLRVLRQERSSVAERR